MEFLLKSSLLIGILYSFYKIFLQKETFFKSIRVYFIIGLFTTVILPLIIIPIYIEVVTSASFIPEIIENFNNTEILPTEILEIETTLPFNWIGLFSIIYFIGVAFFSIKFIIEIASLYKLIHQSNKVKNGKITFIETLKNISPFSVFNFIIFNKKQFKNKELAHIIAHEKVHVKHFHTYDLLIAHLLVIMQWFNPFAWLYKKDLQQNLEFLADKYAQENIATLKEYQYLLLKTSVKQYPFALSTDFYNSLIKKRIIMLQKSPSKKLNQLKYVLLLPLLALFLYAFNTKEVIKPIHEELFPNLVITENNDENIKFVNPIHPSNVIKISSEFGRRKTPNTNKLKFHNGIDILAYKDMDVYAAASGIVIKATYDNLKGNNISIQHANGYQTNYHHLGEIQIALDEQVKAGEIISTVGNSGKSTGPHLHYEVVKDGKNINPKPFVKYFITKTFKIDKNSTKKELKDIENAFENKMSPTKIRFTNIKYNTKKELIHVNIETKFKGNERFTKRMLINNLKPIKTVIISFTEDAKDIIIKTDESIATINKNQINIEDTKNKIELNGYNTVIQSKTTNEELEKIKRTFETINNVTLRIYDVKRDNNNLIIAIKIEGKTKNLSFSYSFNPHKPISNLLLSYNKSSDEITVKNVNANENNSNSYQLESKNNSPILKGKTIKGIMISNKSSNDEIEKMKTDFKKKFNVNLKIFNIKRNNYNEIIALTIEANTKNISKNFSFDDKNSFYSITVNYLADKKEFLINKWSDDTKKYIVKIKDTYYSISKKYGITVEKLRNLNKGRDFKVGATLIIEKDQRYKNQNSSHTLNSTRIVNVIDDKKIVDRIVFAGNDIDKTSFTVNGKKMSADELEKMEKSSIKTLTFNNDNIYLESISSSNQNGNITYLVNGKVTTLESLKKINKNKIKSIKIDSNIVNVDVSEDDNNHSNSGSIVLKQTTYFYNIKNNKTTFYNKFGDKVDNKTAKKLLKLLKTKLH